MEAAAGARSTRWWNGKWRCRCTREYRTLPMVHAAAVAITAAANAADGINGEIPT